MTQIFQSKVSNKFAYKKSNNIFQIILKAQINENKPIIIFLTKKWIYTK